MGNKLSVQKILLSTPAFLPQGLLLKAYVSSQVSGTLYEYHKIPAF
jgi:hypothetical protein